MLRRLFSCRLLFLTALATVLGWAFLSRRLSLSEYHQLSRREGGLYITLRLGRSVVPTRLTGSVSWKKWIASWQFKTGVVLYTQVTTSSQDILRETADLEAGSSPTTPSHAAQPSIYYD